MKRPNILWLMTDEQRCDSLGCYGSRWARTPNLDALAKEGAMFETAVTPAPVCLPARTSILAARYPSQTGVWHNSVPRKTPVPNLMGAFVRAGYRTATFGKQHYAAAVPAFQHEAGPHLSPHVHYFRYGPGHDESACGVLKYPGPVYNWIFGGRFPAPGEETAEAGNVRDAIQWLENSPRDVPFFLRISFNGPHTPVAPPAPFDEAVPEDAVRLPVEAESRAEGLPRWLTEELARCADAAAMTPGQIRAMRRCYYGEVAFLDSLFGRLLDWLRRRGLLDETIVAFCSDHGTHLGDYGFVQKQTFFEPVVNVPFLFRHPRLIPPSAGRRTPVEIRSLLPTLLDLAEIDAPLEGCAPSLAAALRSGGEPPPRPVFSEFTLNSFAPHIRHDGRLVMVRDGDWKLSCCLDPAVHDLALYNLADDPHERENRAGDATCKAARESLLGLIATHGGGPPRL